MSRSTSPPFWSVDLISHFQLVNGVGGPGYAYTGARPVELAQPHRARRRRRSQPSVSSVAGIWSSTAGPCARREAIAEARERLAGAASTSFCSTSTSAIESRPRASSRRSASAHAGRPPSLLLTGSVGSPGLRDGSRSAGRGDLEAVQRSDELTGTRRADSCPAQPLRGRIESSQMSTTCRCAAPQSSRNSSSGISTSGPRRGAPSASARRRSRSRPRSSRATPISSRATQLAALRERGGARRRRRARAALPAAQDVRGRADLGRARRARGRARERDPRRARRRSRARSCRCARRRRSSRCSPDYADRDELGELAGRRRPRRSTTSGSSCSRAGEELEAELSGEPRPGRAQRGGEAASRCASSSARSPPRATAIDGRVRRAARALVRAAARPGPRGAARRRSTSRYMRRLSPLEATYTKERATEVCLATLHARSASTSQHDQNIRLDLDDRPQKSPRACVIASDPPKVVHLITRAQGGLHDYQAFLHEAGHALHYAGCRPVAAVHVPPALARPRADRDLLVHRRGDLARAGLARRALRPLGRGGGRERRGDDLPRGAALPPLHREAPVRARLLVALRRRRRHADGYAERLTERDRASATASDELPRRHGRRLLLGRLPARLDPLGAAPRVPASTRSARTGGASPETGELLRDALRRGHEAVERGDRGAARLRAARHRPARRRVDAVSVRSVAYDHFYAYDEAHGDPARLGRRGAEALFHSSRSAPRTRAETSGSSRSRTPRPERTRTSPPF